MDFSGGGTDLRPVLFLEVTVSRFGGIRKSMLTPDDHIAGLTKMIAAHSGVRRIILFGSRARGYASPRSDIDLAVDINDDAAWHILDEKVEEYPTLLKIDLVRLGDSHGDFQKAILETGKILYERA